MAEGGSSYIPSWDGAEVSFKDFQRACDLLVIGTKADDHGLLGGRVASRLGGHAWEWGEALDKTKLAQKDGVQYLLEYMESCLKGAKVADMGQHAGAYLIHHHRRPGQSFPAYQMETTRLVVSMRKEVIAAMKESKEWKEPDKTGPNADGTFPNLVDLPECLHAWY